MSDGLNRHKLIKSFLEASILLRPNTQTEGEKKNGTEFFPRSLFLGVGSERRREWPGVLEATGQQFSSAFITTQNNRL